jgi:hypothetical protein
VENLGLGKVGREFQEGLTGGRLVPNSTGGGVGEAIAIGVAIEVHRLPKGAEVGETGGAVGLFACTAEGGEEHGDQERDDADDDQEFDQGESPAVVKGLSIKQAVIGRTDWDSYSGCAGCAGWEKPARRGRTRTEMLNSFARHGVTFDGRMSCPHTSRQPRS